MAQKCDICPDATRSTRLSLTNWSIVTDSSSSTSSKDRSSYDPMTGSLEDDLETDAMARPDVKECSSSSTSGETCKPQASKPPRTKEEADVLDKLAHDQMERDLDNSEGPDEKLPQEKRSDMYAQRHQEKKKNCGGNEPNQWRVKEKRQQGRKQSMAQSVLAAADMIEKQKKEGEEMAKNEKEKEKEEEEDEQDEQQNFDQPEFVCRIGGFAQPWYCAWGTPTTYLQLGRACKTYMWSWFNHFYTDDPGFEFYDPRSMIGRRASWKRFNDSDRPVSTPVWTGITKAAINMCLYVVMAGIIYAICALMGMIHLVPGFVFSILQFLAQGYVAMYLLGQCFRPLHRYGLRDFVTEYGRPRPYLGQVRSTAKMRAPQNRFRRACDRPAYAEVHRISHRISDSMSVVERFWSASWMFGSLRSWLDVNRWVQVIENDEDLFVSMRVVHVVIQALHSATMDSYEAAYAKASAIASHYDEVLLRIAPINGRNILADSIDYSVDLFWSESASSPRMGNGVCQSRS